ncbi:MAG: Transcriptional regulator, TrmB [Candidatus Nomurabacteria bacterium GW2011_GWF2_43_8]|uniref:Transcriptional regulator, TrmB n=3 Tax=Candidatus Nomuraibacteriota TaxID=1752729 RepID=A0A0G1IN72_9BACT|nr:MAG: Transcriptional regulator, TrmB [Candidatus Nomurabacteria bacterium GW2011_GWA2_43_15]KKT19531.1 MAG: Transcriptional regulator, TrmB [Candidatus Nomurabacteria bacterium GW2011_GWB1_43_7]KKT24604.1 MAG: Transcriptional regulator, TrmB [Candidatus Nomurabacteria bacterium GW2011_GWF2_43_8]
MKEPIKNKLQKILLEIGFSAKEADVYLATLVLGRGTASKIAREARIARTTVYDILGSLFDKGLVTLTGKEPKQEYVAESPNQLREYILGEFNKKQKDLKKADSTLIPQLKSIHNIENHPKVMFYEGREGLERVYEDTLTSHEPIRAYASVGDMNIGLPGYFPGYFKRRAGKGIAIRAIIPDTEAGLERKTFDKEEMRETALVPKNSFLFSPEINIYDNKVMIASWREKLGIIIESNEIADAMKKIFELAWAEAKRLDGDLRRKSDF